MSIDPTATYDTDTTLEQITGSDDVTVDLTRTTYKSVQNLLSPGSNLHTESALQEMDDATVRVEFSEHWREGAGVIAAICRRRSVLPKFKDHPEEFSEYNDPDAYKQMKQKLCGSSGDEIVFTAEELITLDDIVATWMLDIDTPNKDKHTAALNYLDATVSGARKALIAYYLQ